jgi:hypothetical protein
MATACTMPDTRRLLPALQVLVLNDLVFAEVGR